MANKFDSINTKPKGVFFRPKESKQTNHLFYFYKSLRIVLLIWIILIVAITATPWLDYWVKTKISQGVNEKLSQILGVATVSKNVISDTVNQSALESRFILKNSSVDINAPIVDGIEKENLAQGIGHHKESVWPSEKGNVVLAGHNVDLDAENPYGKVFFDLRDGNISDEVSVYYKGLSYHYKIFKKETVSPEDTSLFSPVDDWQLTFYTCDPPYTDWKRLVFQAKLIKIE